MINYKDKGWKEFRSKYINKDSKCCRCESKDHLSLHHNHYNKKKSLSLSIICRKCHFMIHNFGTQLCSRCKKKYTKWDECWDCHKKTEEEIEKDMQEICDWEDDFYNPTQPCQ